MNHYCDSILEILINYYFMKYLVYNKKIFDFKNADRNLELNIDG